MAIQFAFSNVACPDWPLEQILENAGQWGYTGIELRTLGPGSTQLASDPALTSAEQIARQFEQAKLLPVCISSSTSLHHSDDTAIYQATLAIEQNLQLASEIGCPAVRIFGSEVKPGLTRNSVMQQIARNVKPLADIASKLGVQILFENAGSFSQAKEWWWLHNLIDHPMVGMCWNIANAAAVGETPAVSVPNLHTRIKLAKVKDIAVGSGDGFVALGEGTVPVQTFIKRLLGIGYGGYVSVEWDRLWLDNMTPPEEYLPQAMERLKGWLSDNDGLEAKGQKMLDKAAKRNAPKSAAELAGASK